MLFRSYKPMAPLSEFIENFWLYQGYSSPHAKERILPSGTFELVFNLAEDELRIYATDHDGCRRFSGAIVSGPYAGTFVTDTAEEAFVMGVHFKPGGAFPFLGFPAGDFTNSHVNLEAVLGRAAAELRDRLATADSNHARFRVLEKALLTRLRRAWQHHYAVSFALHAFTHAGVQPATSKLAWQAGLSEKRFIDVFRSEVGLTPKLFSRVMRFQKVISLVRHKDDKVDWAQLATDAGCFDQSHLIREFLSFAGLSPDGYSRRLSNLRRKGLHVKHNHISVLE